MEEKTVEQSVRILEGVSQALLAIKETFVKNREDKDKYNAKGLAIIERELDFLGK